MTRSLHNFLRQVARRLAWLLGLTFAHVHAADLNPQQVGSYVVDLQNWSPMSVAASGSRAYAIGQYDRGNFTWVTSMLILDVANPRQPALLGTYNLPNGANNVVLRDELAYVSSGGSGEDVIIIDITDPKALWRKGGYNTSGSAFQIFLVGNYAYIADGEAGLVVLDVTNPASPRRVGGVKALGEVSSVFVSGDYAYLAERFHSDAENRDLGALEIMDISTPDSPTWVSTYPIDYGTWSVLVAGSVAYVGGGNGEELALIDVSNPANPQPIGNYRGSGPRGVLSGNRAYMYGGDLHVLDISNPASPRKLGSYQPDEGLSFWGIGVAGRYAYLGVGGNAPGGPGLAVIEVDAPPAPPPPLGIARSSDRVTLTWPDAAAGFALESSDSLAPAANWTTERTAPEIVGDQNLVTIETAGGAKFFRLKKP